MERDKAVKRYPLEMSYELQTKLRDAVYFSGQSIKEILLNGANEEVDRLLQKFATNAQRADTERQGLTRKPLIPFKKIIKNRV